MAFASAGFFVRYPQNVRVFRIDRAIARVDFTPGAQLAPGVAPAREDPNTGYLHVAAYFARDGLLEYSDGKRTWLEYRPRDELIAAAPSFAYLPYTDTHPAKMVDSRTWSDVARGITLGRPRVTEPLQGVSYLQGEILVTDHDIIKTMRDGRDQLSIGFGAEMVPAVNGRADDGTRCHFVQTSMLGNHLANVDVGRAGPTCRVFLDSAAWTVQDPWSMADKNDQLGAPTETVQIPGPDGTTVEIPTWLAAQMEQQAMELTQLKSALQPAAPGPMPPAAPPMPAPEAPIEALDAPQMPPPPTPPAPPSDDEDEDEDMTDQDKDKKPAPGLSLDSAAAKAFIAKKMPHLEAKLDSADDATVSAWLTAALSQPDPEPVTAVVESTPRVDDGTNPLQQPAPLTPKVDAADLALWNHLNSKSQGYSA